MSVARPAIISRATWRANPLVTPAARIGTPCAEHWLHHTAAMGLHGPSGMRVLQANAKSGGYSDLEYTWIVDNPNGWIYESRGNGRNTAATYQHNTISQAICVMGNFQIEQPSAAVLESVAQLTAWMHDQGVIQRLITGPHRNASGNSTACCGDHLIDQIPAINRRAQAILDGKPDPPKPEPRKVHDLFLLFRVPDAATPEGRKDVYVSDGIYYERTTADQLKALQFVAGSQGLPTAIGTLTKAQIGNMERIGP